MSVEITRVKQYIQSLGKFKVKLNGEQIVKIKNGETEYIEIDHDGSVLQVRNGLEKSNKLAVNDGDRVEIKVRFWTLWYGFIAILLATLYAAFTPVDIVMMAILTFFGVWIPTIVFPVTDIRKIEKDKRG